MHCETCRIWTGALVKHEHDECELRANLICRRCCGSGHSTPDCTWEPVLVPTCLEDLIPCDLKEHYNITTQTAYKKTGLVKKHDVQNMTVRNDDKWIREFMGKNHIKTERKRADNLDKIMKWAELRGLNVMLVSQE